MSTDPSQLDPNTLARLVVDALERTAFVLADPCDDPDQLPAADTFAQIDFSGPTRGNVELRASRSFARNLLGRAFLDDNMPKEAAQWFLKNYQANKSGDRAPDSLFFLGSALTDLGKAAEACEAFGELARAYPDAATGRLAERLTSGKTRAKCK